MFYDRKSAITNKELQIQEEFLCEIFKPEENFVVFDIGACEGESSIRYSNLFSNAKIYTFEPVPNNFKKVEQNIADFNATNVKPFQLCLSNGNGEAEFHVSSGQPEEFKNKQVDWEFGNKSSSLLPPDKTLNTYTWLEFKDKIKVKTIRLDSFLKEKQIEQIDFVHMDVQGAELMVLNGAGNKLNSIKNIWLEVAAIPLYKGQPIKKDIKAFLSARGFVKISENFDKVAGDQFWSKQDWILNRMGEKWLTEKMAIVQKEENSRKVGLVKQIRDKVQLRSRIIKLFK
jgi:FkbM family methyltransferase